MQKLSCTTNCEFLNFLMEEFNKDPQITLKEIIGKCQEYSYLGCIDDFQGDSNFEDLDFQQLHPRSGKFLGADNEHFTADPVKISFKDKEFTAFAYVEIHKKYIICDEVQCGCYGCLDSEVFYEKDLKILNGMIVDYNVDEETGEIEYMRVVRAPSMKYVDS